MENRELKKQYDSIKLLIDSAQESTYGDIQLQGHWGRYLCILASGFLENAISEIYVEVVKSAAAPHVVKYTSKTLDKIQNPKAKRFIDTASQFKSEWGEELEKFLKEDPSRKSAIDSIMTNRHQIAHGKSCNISVHRVREYLEKSVEVIKFIEGQCKNTIAPI